MDNAQLNAEVQSLQEKVAELEKLIVTVVKEIPERTVELLKQNGFKNAPTTISVTELEKILKDHNTALLSKVSSQAATKAASTLGSSIENTVAAVLKSMTKGSSSAEVSSPVTIPNSASNLTAFAKALAPASTGKVGDFQRLLPENYKLPSTNVKTFWELWYGGNEEEGVPPLHTVKKNKRYHELDFQDKKTYSKGKTLMAEMEHFARREGLIADPSTLYSLSPSDLEETFFKIYEVFVHYVYGKKCHRPLDKSVGTLLNRLREVKKERGFVDDAASIGSSSSDSMDAGDDLPPSLKRPSTVEVPVESDQAKKKQKTSAK
mmetsp:Transcript_1253/g.1301  ORF Transcript_1253/g.1301 Transcript_1253/m.1301 type:complete len:320 (-) Transcript_1253:56-1015(-)|eukprot:gene13930-15379_t